MHGTPPRPSDGRLTSEQQQAVAQGMYRGPSYVILDAQGYDLALARASVGSGWHLILEHLFKEKENLAEVRIEQVKQKMGFLRVYFRIEGKDTDQRQAQQAAFKQAVAAAERESTRTCEYCGGPGSHRAYVRVRCDEHVDVLRVVE